MRLGKLYRPDYKNMRLHNIYFMLFFFIIACTNDEEDNLPSVEERVAAAVNDLKNDLTAPPNGWRVNYQPTPQAGIFFMILDFDEDGMVTIKTDVVDNDGEFIKHTVPYRIDHAHSLELIFETYGVFHHLFEKDQASFGAEFEFLYSGKQGENLVFVSKSDLSNRTVMVFEPAGPGDETLLSTEIVENLDQFYGLTPQIFGRTPPIQQLILQDKNISVFWSIDPSKRVISVDMAGTGTTIEEISNKVPINHTTGYALMGGKLVLMDPLSFDIGGESITIAEIELNDFNMNGESFCSLNTVNTPVYEGQIEGLGQVTIKKSLFSSKGADFQPMSSHPYSVNVLFVFDESGSSLLEEGIIGEKFPNATGFLFNYELESQELPANAVGFIVEDESGEGQFYLREFEPTVTEGNKIAIALTNNFYYSTTPAPEDEQNLIDITDKIFEGNEMYAFDLPVQGNKVFRLFNPCNQYELFLVQ
jgi:hypothetical protein